MFALRRFSFLRPPKFDRCVESLREQFIQQTAVRNLGGVSGTSGELFSSTQCPQQQGYRRNSMSLILSRALSDDRGGVNDDSSPKDGESSPPAAGIMKEGRDPAEKIIWIPENEEDKEAFKQNSAPGDEMYDRGSWRLFSDSEGDVYEILTPDDPFPGEENLYVHSYDHGAKTNIAEMDDKGVLIHLPAERLEEFSEETDNVVVDPEHNFGSIRIKLDDITGIELASGEQIEDREQIIEYLKREVFAAPLLESDDEENEDSESDEENEDSESDEENEDSESDESDEEVDEEVDEDWMFEDTEETEEDILALENLQEEDLESYVPPSFRCSTDDITKLDVKDVGKLYNVSGVTERQYIPEGCGGLRAEFEATEVRRLLLRENFLRLIQLDLVPEGKPAKKPILLQGPLGAGKSILLSQVVHWARASGWLVMYLPNAPHLLSNSSFVKNEATGMWDTPDTVYDLLQDFQKAHGELLDELESSGGASTLGALVEDALQLAAPGQTKPPPADQVVDACLNVIEEVEKVTKVPTLICMDSYNSLFGGSEFYEPMENHRRQIPAAELRLVAKLRDMSSGMANGTRVAATSMSARVPEKIPLLNVPQDARRRVRTFNYDEADKYLAHI
ncbi:hypothetical protein CYMTET_55767, partial [Cymbomonas tetramitiformis]